MTNQYKQPVLPSMLIQDDAREEKWKPLTEGIEEEYGHHLEDPGLVRRATEIAFEASLQQLSLPPQQGGIGISALPGFDLKQIQEAVSTASIAAHQKYSLGLIRRVVPLLLGPESLVSVQTMPMPAAPIFYLTHQYGTAKAPTVAGTRLDTIATRDETYSGGRHHDDPQTAAGAPTTDYDLEHAGTQSHQVYLDGVLQTLTTHYTIGTGTGAGGVDQVLFVAAPGAGVIIDVSYIGYVEGDTPRDIDLQITSETVTAEDQALRGGFSTQAMQDAMAYHSISLDAELSSVMAYEFLAQTDYNIAKELFEWASAGNVNWSSTGYLAGDTSTADRREYRRTLYEAIVEAADLIFSLRHRDPTWILGGTSSIQRLFKLENFQLLPAGKDNLKKVGHRVPVGTIAGTYTVYKDSRMPTNKLLLGYKGSTPFHVGYIYAIYQLLYKTPLMPDPNATFNYKRGMLTRAARKRVDMNLYSTVTIT